MNTVMRGKRNPRIIAKTGIGPETNPTMGTLRKYGAKRLASSGSGGQIYT